MKFLWVIAAMLVTFSMLGCVIERTENAGLTPAQISDRTNAKYFERKAAAMRQERQEDNDFAYYMLQQEIKRRARQ